jgi:hypothetical protein
VNEARLPREPVAVTVVASHALRREKVTTNEPLLLAVTLRAELPMSRTTLRRTRSLGTNPVPFSRSGFACVGRSRALRAVVGEAPSELRWTTTAAIAAGTTATARRPGASLIERRVM